MLSFINSNIFGPLLTLMLTVSSIFLLVKLRFKPFLRPIKMLSTFRGKNSKAAFGSACLSLSGTLGVGNIAGVAAAIGTGGAGSVFWMWIFALMAMVIKYCEVVLSMSYNKRGEGGAALYIDNGLNMKRTASLFSVLIIISSIGVGNTVQSSAAAESMRVCLGIPNVFTGIIFSVITLIMICGGRKRIERASVLVIPILSLGFIIISLSIIISNRETIPSILKMIISDALKIRSISGGVFGSIFSKSLRLGASRGILSNEAGCGTAAFAHNTRSHPAEQGVWGIFEVFVDTILLCTLTAFVVLLTPNIDLNGNGIRVALDAYGQYSGWIKSFIGYSAAIYALASVVCWSYYGVSSISYLGGNKNSRRLYLLIYSMAGIFGSVFTPSLVWEISDLTISLMVIINMFCVLKLWREIKEKSDEYF